jgi:hypothetical protein
MNHDRFASGRLILLATLLTCFALCATAPGISALTITGNFTGGTAPANARGGGATW